MNQTQQPVDIGVGSKIRVFLADAQPVVRSGIALLLQLEEDIEIVGESGDGREVIGSVRELLPDVLLMDIDLSGIDGLDATRQISESVPAVSVLILTASEREDDLSQALKAGASGYMLKRANIEELVGAIRSVHSGETFIYPRMTTKLVADYVRRLHNGNGQEDLYSMLSLREREVLPLLAEGHTNHEIGDLLFVSPYTVQTYRQRIMKKLNLHSGTELLRYALRKGIIKLGQDTSAF
ncbi:MAG: response regulator transcription factor [Chloroflexi bacterium]|nr:response regulator transcription factor [Chloroflexota bacterium]